MFRGTIAERVDRVAVAGCCDAAALARHLASDFYKSALNLSSAEVAVIKTVEGLTSVIQQRRADPGDDLLSRMVGDVDDSDAVGLSMRIWLGVEVLFEQASMALVELARQPHLAAWLRNHPEAVSGFIEEVLRLDSVIPWTNRKLLTDTEVAGVTLPAGSWVRLCLSAIHRDGSDEWSTDDMRLDSRGHPHWAFGSGFHRCRGSHLIREVLRAFVEEWVTRVPQFRTPMGWQPVLSFPAWSVDQLPLTFTSTT